MEVLRNCSIVDCPKPPQIVCKCTPTGQMFCEEHLVQHTQWQPGAEHKIIPIWINISSDQNLPLQQAKQQLMQKKSQAIKKVLQASFLQYKNLQQQAQIIKENTQYQIQHIENKYMEVLTKIEDYLANFAGRQQAENSPQLLNTPFHIYISDEPLPSLISPSDTFFCTFLFFFKNNTKQFCRVDLKNKALTSNLIDIPDNMGQDEVCWADHKSLIFTGSEYSNSQFRIDVDSLQVYPVPSFPFHAKWGAVVQHKGSFFRFGGNFQRKEVYKWNKKSIGWNLVAQLPSRSNYVTAVSVRDCILVTGCNMGSVYAFYEQQNRFEEVLKSFSGKDKKLLVTSKGEVLCLCQEHPIQACGVQDLKNWRSGGAFNFSPLSKSVVGEYMGFVYFANSTGQLVGINIQNFQNNNFANYCQFLKKLGYIKERIISLD